MPADFEKSFPLPIGITPRSTSLSYTEFTISLNVPSPPTDIICVYPLLTALIAKSDAWPLALVSEIV